MHSFLAFPPRVEGEPCGAWAVRAELDALPITEVTGLPYASVNEGVMHACGHDLHSGVLMALAYYCAGYTSRARSGLALSRFAAPVLIFQSSEEVLPGGAKDLIQSEAYRSASPCFVLAFHADPDLHAGTVGYRSGPFLASGDEVYITLSGRGGHAARPQYGDDLLLVASQILVNLQSIASRFAPQEVPMVLSFGRFAHEGAMNVFPPTVRMEGTLRTHDEGWRQEVHRRIERVAKGVADAYGVSAEVDIRHGYPSLSNDPERTERVVRTLRAFSYGDGRLGPSLEEVPLRMTTDDIAYYSQTVPTVQLRLGVGPACSALHTPGFNPDERALGVGLLALIALAHGEAGD